MHIEILSAKWRPLCPGEDALTGTITITSIPLKQAWSVWLNLSHEIHPNNTKRNKAQHIRMYISWDTRCTHRLDRPIACQYEFFSWFYRPWTVYIECFIAILHFIYYALPSFSIFVYHVLCSELSNIILLMKLIPFIACSMLFCDTQRKILAAVMIAAFLAFMILIIINLGTHNRIKRNVTAHISLTNVTYRSYSYSYSYMIISV